MREKVFKATAANKHENTPCFPFCDNKSLQSIVTFIIQCTKHIFTPHGIICRYVLMQLACALLIPRERRESN